MSFDEFADCILLPLVIILGALIAIFDNWD